MWHASIFLLQLLLKQENLFYLCAPGLSGLMMTGSSRQDTGVQNGYSCMQEGS